jgi:hypothetical protein
MSMQGKLQFWSALDQESIARMHRIENTPNSIRRLSRFHERNLEDGLKNEKSLEGENLIWRVHQNLTLGPN